MMKTRLLLLLTSLFALTVSAERINEQQALEKARQFMQGKVLNSAHQTRNVRRASASSQLQNLYIFNVEDNGGFVIVSVDDRTDAILGYSTSGRFDEQHIPDNFRAWLQQTETEIESLPASTLPGSEDLMPATRRAAKHAKINPLVITSWNQGNYGNDTNSDGVYNIHLPKIGSKYPCTGCVAVVGAQLMYYYQWPKDKTQSVPGYSSSSQANTSVDLQPIKFQWSKMKTSYVVNDPNTEAVNAVADLLLYSAYATQMYFGVGGSSGSTYTLAQGLCSYFDYDPDSWKNVSRSDYSVSEWDALIYHELACGRPVLYSGDSDSGGHAFICDGYDGEGMYHFNWGWGGSSDGYFKLQATNPYGSGGIGFIYNHSCIIGLQPSSWPAVEDPNGYDMWQSPVIEGIVGTGSIVKVEGNTVTMKLGNENDGTYGFGFGIGELNSNGSVTPIDLKHENLNTTDLPKGYYFSKLSFDFSSYNLSNGTHILVPISLLRGETAWRRCKPGNLYFEVNVTNGNKSIVVHPQKKLTVGDMDLTNGGNVGQSQSVRMTITNEGDHYDGWLYVFVDDKNHQAGSLYAKMAAGNTKEYHISVGALSAGTHTLILSSDWNCETIIASKEVTVAQDLRATQFNYLDNLTVNRVQRVAVEVDNHAGDYNQPLYLFANTSNSKQLVYASGSAVEGGGSDEVTFYFWPDQAGAWNLWVATDYDGTNVIGQATAVISEAFEQKLQISSTIQNMSDYVVKAENFTIHVNVANQGTYAYNDEITANLFKLRPGTNMGDLVQTKKQVLQLAPSANQALQFIFDDLEDGSSYFYWIGYYSKGDMKSVGFPTYQYVYTPAEMTVKTVQDKANAKQFVGKYVNNGKYPVYISADDAKVFSIYVDGDAAYFQACRVADNKCYINVGEHVIFRTDTEKEVRIHVDATYHGLSSIGYDDIYDAKVGDDLAAVEAGVGLNDDMYLYRLTNVAGQGFGFTYFSGTTIKVGQFFVACSKKPSGSGRLTTVWLDENGNVESETTGIETIGINDADNAAIYNLQGVRVEKPRKGLYIQRGKKIIVK